MRHAGSDVDSLRSSFGAAASLTMEESRHGPIFRCFRSTSQSAVGAPPMRPTGDPVVGEPGDGRTQRSPPW